MLVLVLADNLLLLYLGWEGVGLCSYLLIGFWYRDAANGDAARKAFVVTRIGDTAMAIGLFVIVQHLGTLDIPQVLERAGARWTPGGTLAVAVRGAPPRRRGRQVGAAPAPDLAARRDGRPDAGLRADPRRDHGDRRRLPHRAHARAVHAGAAGDARGRGDRRRDAAGRRLLARWCSATSSACSPTPPSASSATCSWRSASARGRRRCSTS